MVMGRGEEGGVPGLGSGLTSVDPLFRVGPGLGLPLLVLHHDQAEAQVVDQRIQPVVFVV